MMPTDPIKRIQWIADQRAELDDLLARAMFDARLQGRLDEAMTASGIARKPAIKMTRQVNERLGRQVRWGSA